jgi:hypothetical protein
VFIVISSIVTAAVPGSVPGGVAGRGSNLRAGGDQPMAAVQRIGHERYRVGNAVARAACEVDRLAARGTLQPLLDDEQAAGPARLRRPWRGAYFWIRVIFVPCSPAPAIRPDWPKTKA